MLQRLKNTYFFKFNFYDANNFIKEKRYSSNKSNLVSNQAVKKRKKEQLFGKKCFQV